MKELREQKNFKLLNVIDFDEFFIDMSFKFIHKKVLVF